MKHNRFAVKSILIAAVLFLSFSLEAFADKFGPGNLNGNVSSSSTQQSDSGSFSVNDPSDPSVYNGSGSLEAGRVTEDAILHKVPQLHMQYKTGDGNLTDGFVSGQDFFNSPHEGFSGIRGRLEYSIGDFYYRAYTSENGWTKWCINERDTEWFNDAAKITAVQLFIKGHTANQYDLFYRVELNDGTVTDWAHNGQSCGAMGTGQYIQKMQTMLWKKGVPFFQPTTNILRAAHYEGIVYGGGGVSYSKADGSAYTGWAYDTSGGKYYFRDNQKTTGWSVIDGYKYYFDERGRVVTDLEPVIGAQSSYLLSVNKELNTMTVFAKDDSGAYKMPYKVFLVTTGSATPVGTFSTFDYNRWKFMHDDIYVQYCMRYKTGGFCIHSIIYYPQQGSYQLRANSYNELGKNASDGCIRLLSGDCAWIFNNCKQNTTVEVYNDSWSFGPLDRPCIEQAIPSAQNWDPTDPVVIQDIQNKTGPFTNGVVTVAYPDTFIPKLRNHGAEHDAELADAAAAVSAAETNAGGGAAAGDASGAEAAAAEAAQ